MEYIYMTMHSSFPRPHVLGLTQHHPPPMSDFARGCTTTLTPLQHYTTYAREHIPFSGFPFAQHIQRGDEHTRRRN